MRPRASSESCPAVPAICVLEGRRARSSGPASAASSCGELLVDRRQVDAAAPRPRAASISAESFASASPTAAPIRASTSALAGSAARRLSIAPRPVSIRSLRAPRSRPRPRPGRASATWRPAPCPEGSIGAIFGAAQMPSPAPARSRQSTASVRPASDQPRLLLVGLLVRLLDRSTTGTGSVACARLLALGGGVDRQARASVVGRASAGGTGPASATASGGRPRRRAARARRRTRSRPAASDRQSCSAAGSERGTPARGLPGPTARPGLGMHVSERLGSSASGDGCTRRLRAASGGTMPAASSSGLGDAIALGRLGFLSRHACVPAPPVQCDRILGQASGRNKPMPAGSGVAA